MQIANAILEARSQSQAMDWSLVLISQGIESVLLQRAEDGVWILEVAPHDAARAVASITAYERENATVWRHEVKWTGLLFDARAVFWYAMLALLFWLDARSQLDLRAAGMVVRSSVLHGEWWRLFTAVTLHADVAHLAANVTTGIVFTGLAMGCFGAGHALLLSFLGGALGNLISLALHGDPFQSLGASGMVMASLGLLTAESLIAARRERPRLLVSRGVIAGCLLVVLLGFSPRSDVLAHVGGFAAGTALGAMALQFGLNLQRRWANLASSILCLLLPASAWWIALRR